MKRVIIIVALLLSLPAFAQRYVKADTDVGATVRVVASDPDGDACTLQTPPVVRAYHNGDALVFYNCTASTWQAADIGMTLKNSQTITYCAADICDYVSGATPAATMQAAVNYAMSVASVDNPVEIVILPDVYLFETVVDITDISNVTIRGTDRDATILSGTTTAVFSAGLQTVDMEKLTFANMTLESLSSLSCLFLSSENTDFGIEAEYSNLRFRCDNRAITQYGSRDVGASRSVGRLRNSIFEVDGYGVLLDGALQFYSSGNIFKTMSGLDAYVNPSAAGTVPSRVAAGFRFMGQYTDSYFSSVNDYFYLSVPDAAAPTGSPYFPFDVTAYYVFNGYKTVISGAHIDIGSASDNDNVIYGAGIIQAGGMGTLDVYNTTVVYKTSHANNSIYGVSHSGGDASLILHSVEFDRGNGPGTEYDVQIDDGGELYLTGSVQFDDTGFDTIGGDGTTPYGGYPPRVLARTFPAVQSIATPATAAAFDALSEYRYFDDTVDENTSWRNWRVSDLAWPRPLFAARARLTWYPVTASSGSVVWQVGFCSSGEDDAYPCTISTWAEIDDSVCATCAAGDLHISGWVDIDSSLLAAGEDAVLQIKREATDSDDTMTGDAALIKVELQYEVQ